MKPNFDGPKNYFYKFKFFLYASGHCMCKKKFGDAHVFISLIFKIGCTLWYQCHGTQSSPISMGQKNISIGFKFFSVLGP